MKPPTIQSLLTFFLVLLLAAALAWAGSQGGVRFLGAPVFALAVGLAFLVNWLAFIPAYLLRSEKFFDLTGGLTFVSVTALALALTPERGPRAWLLLALVLLWAARLSAFLFLRIRRAGEDIRFRSIKTSFLRFLLTWTLQGLWAAMTLSAALAAITSVGPQRLDAFAVAGFLVWLTGFVIEVTADAQKSRFNADPANKGKFIRTGLWSRSRHPNYFGEILLWLGIAVIALPALHGWTWVTLLSPVFVAFLLLRVSGIPLLERRADEKWGGQEAYELYKTNTPLLIPRLWKGNFLDTWRKP